jgi:hypothetical protein
MYSRGKIKKRANRLVGSSVSFRLIYCLENTVAGLPTGIKLLRIRTTIIAKIITREFREGLNMMFRLIIRASGNVSIGNLNLQVYIIF